MVHVHRLREAFVLGLVLLVPSGAAHAQEVLLDGNGATGDGFAGGGFGLGFFGGSGVAVDGDVVVAGSPGDDVLGQADRGSATVFTWNGSSFPEVAELSASSGAAGDLFGWSVAVSGDVIVVGAPEATAGATALAGTATVFRRTGGVWAEEQVLTAGTPAAGDYFGTFVAVDGDVIAVGALLDDVGANIDAGSVTVFRFDGATWNEEQQLFNGVVAPNDYFGHALALQGDVLAVGSPRDDIGLALDAGSVTVFGFDGVSWNAQQQVLGIGGAAFDNFGSSVALDGDLLVAGSPSDDSAEIEDKGSISIYRNVAGSWSAQQKLGAAGPPASSLFGFSVAARGDLIAAGQPGETVGKTFLLRFDGSSWGVEDELTDAPAFAKYGAAVALDGGRLLVGAPTGGPANQGAAYLYVVDTGLFTEVGGGTAGISGVPSLELSGSLEPDTLLALQLTDAAPSSLGGLFLSVSSTPTPFVGGTLHAFPFLQLVLVGTDPAGGLSGVTGFAGAPGGTSFWVQVAVQDASVPVYGISLSNGVRATVP